MGCNTDNNEDFGGGSDSAGHCNTWTPPSGSGVTMTVNTYPSRNQYNLNWPDVDRDRVMYDSFIRTGDVPTRESCGKEKKLIDTIFGMGRPGAGGAASTAVYRVYQHVPKELSLYPIDSDMWFRIQYDTADYFVCVPCKDLRLSIVLIHGHRLQRLVHHLVHLIQKLELLRQLRQQLLYRNQGRLVV